MTSYPTLPGANGILKMPGFQCLNQESPRKTKTWWSHLLALGGGRREGSFGGEWCDIFFSGCWRAITDFSPPSVAWACTSQWRALCLPLRFLVLEQALGPWLRAHAVFAAMFQRTGLFPSLGLNILNYKRFCLILTS